MPAYLIDHAAEVNPRWLAGVETVAVTAGASAPENLVQELIASLARDGFDTVEEMTFQEEDVRFALPGELAASSSGLTTIAIA